MRGVSSQLRVFDRHLHLCIWMVSYPTSLPEWILVLGTIGSAHQLKLKLKLKLLLTTCRSSYMYWNLKLETWMLKGDTRHVLIVYCTDRSEQWAAGLQVCAVMLTVKWIHLLCVLYIKIESRVAHLMHMHCHWYLYFGEQWAIVHISLRVIVTHASNH